MNSADYKIDSLQKQVNQIEYLLQDSFPDDANLLERREMLIEQIGVLLEAKTLEALFDTDNF